VGQAEVFRPVLTWLHRRPDVRSVLMIHDVIPLELPDLHLPIGVRFHHSIVKNTAEFAQGMIVPSKAAGRAILQEVRKYRKAELLTHVELLPVPSEFLILAPKDAELSKSNFFIVCGAIDAHKNHLLLLDVWNRLVARHGMTAPKLLMVGTAGVTSGPALECFWRSKSIHNHVTIITGLSTPALRQLVSHARALLMPSLAEGFGLPIVEALAQHTPVVASDIPAHREAGAGGSVTYLDPTDAGAWLGCIERMAQAPRRAASQLDFQYRPKTWPDYFAGIENFFATLDRQGANRQHS
jgi:glycosyltransferase involved in cell wall biosynthesis